MMLVLPVEEVGSPYNGSIRFAPAFGWKSCRGYDRIRTG